MQHEMHILVVDDHSPDGTSAMVQCKMQEYPNLHLISGAKKGLGTAYIRGMRYALNALRADAVMEMDADFSHKPEDVPRLIKALEAGADFVIGSRYVVGGSIPPEWSAWRKLNSRVGNIMARYVAGMYHIKDCTAGFRAIRATLLENINLSSLNVQGYAFQIALLHAALVQKAVIQEIPVDFVDRIKGHSKLGLRDIVEFLINAWWIRLCTFRTFIKFSLVGLSGVVVNVGGFTVLLSLGLNKYLASPSAIALAILWNFLCNHYWTFRRRDTTDGTQVQGRKFNVVAFLALGISYLTFILLSWYFPQGQPQLYQIIGIVPASLVNYFLNSYWTFREKPA
jgi:dolichol-phosphate mannosyltransferase